MYEVTQSERDMYKQTGSVKRGYIDIIPLSDTEETITLDEYDIKDFTILDDIYTPEQGIIGSIIAKQLTLNLFKPTDIDLTNREINVFIGVDILENGEWITKYIPFGTFIIQKPDSEEITNKTSFDAFDFMVKFNLPFEDTLTYPCTIKDVLNAICEQCGVELATTSFANENFVVENNQFVNGESCRDVLKAIAQISGSFARIGRDNKLYLGFLNPENYETFDDTDYNKDIKINNTFGPVNRLVLRMSQVEGENVVVQDNESISQIGIKELIISDNPFTYTQEKRENAITQIWNKVKGLTYIDYDMKVIPRPYMDVGDSVKILTQNNVQYNSYLFTHELNYTGGLSGNMTATADTETETKYAFIPQLSTRMRHAEIIVDKHTAQVEIITNKTSQLEDNMNNNYYQKDAINEIIVNTETGVTNTFSEAGGNNILRNTGLWFQASKDKSRYLYPKNDLYPSSDLYMIQDASYEFWNGYAKKSINDKAVNSTSIILQNGIFSQEQNVPNGYYSVSFYYKKLNVFARASVKINDVEYPLESMEYEQFYSGKKDENGEYIVPPIEVTSRHFKIEFFCNMDDGLEIYDLMVNKGSVKLAYSQNENEVTTDTVNISKGITITSSNMETKFKADADGIRITKLNDETVSYFTEKGLETKEAVIEDEANICKTIVIDVGDQTWFTRM